MMKITVLLLALLIIGSADQVNANDAGSGGHEALVRTLSSYTLGKTGLNVGGAFKLATEMEYVAGKDGKGSITKGVSGSSEMPFSRENPFLLTGDIFCAYGLFSFLDVAADLPVYYDVTGWGEKVSGLGDLSLSLKMANPFQKDGAFFSHAYYFRIMLPTGSLDRGFFSRHSYYLDDTTGQYTFTGDAVFFNPALVWTIDLAKVKAELPLQLHVNFGGVIAEKRRNSAVVAAVGAAYTPHPLITVFTEVSGESRVKYYNQILDASAFNNDQLWLTPGVRMNFASGFYMMLAGDFGLSDNDPELFVNWKRSSYTYSTKATPLYGFQITAGWKGIVYKPDSDGDGLLDEVDNCDEQAEDRDNFQDGDGCPDNDNDRDGFIDSQDRCPDSAGTNGGCPVYDTDADGMNDASDKCPKEAEDKDGFQDNDGCPETDNDLDGLTDVVDKCPDEAEDKDGFQDNDGCPEFDNDGDGVHDEHDKCPGVPGLPENGGCPKTKEISRGKLILSGVTFQAGKAILTSNSYTILDQVLESLIEWPEVKLEIQGHTDNNGNDNANLRLSQLRADEVKNYLVKRGIESSRLRSVGYGEEFPIADNHTADGREKNRRVELRRID